MGFSDQARSGFRGIELHGGSKRKRCARSSAEEIVGGDVWLPHRRFEHGPVVIGGIRSIALRHLPPHSGITPEPLVDRLYLLKAALADQRADAGIDITAIGNDGIAGIGIANPPHERTPERPNRTDPTAARATPAAATAIDCQASLPFVVGTTGSGGRL